MDSYIYAIVALLPLAASMLVFQTNPYHALVIRGILGAIAALMYAVLGAADVALTEALVGTLLAIMLYAVAVRSSLVLRLGVLKEDFGIADCEADSIQAIHFKQRLDDLRTLFQPYHLRVELVPYLSQSELSQALINKDVHAICAPLVEGQNLATQPTQNLYHTTTRLRRIYEILQTDAGFSNQLVDPNFSKTVEVQV